MRRASARISTTELQNCTLIRIEGEIDESFDPSAIAGRRGVVVIDLDGVRRITSHGVLQWITALRGLEANYYCFINCRPCTMDQFNLVHGFRQNGEVVSFYAMFSCPACAHELAQLIDLRHSSDIVETLALPHVACPKCGGATEFDEVPDLYFRHVRSSPPPRPPPAANAAIGGDLSVVPRGRRFEMKKEVEQSLTVFWMSGYLDRGAYFKRAADGIEGVVMLEIGAVEGIANDAIAGLRQFLRRLDGRVSVARVPPALIDPLIQVSTGSGTGSLQIASYLAPVRCTGCDLVFGAEVGCDKLIGLADGTSRPELCPRCVHPLEPQWTAEVAATAAAAFPPVECPAVVQAYLRAHPPSGRFLVGDRLASTLDPQRLLLGKYQILHPIGQGGMGEVFLARHLGPENFEKLVVLKRIRRDRLGDRDSRDLFLEEARIAARLSHPNIVRIFDLERVDDEYLISMEYVNGIDLARAIQLSRELKIMWPIEICCRVLAELCAALTAAHDYHDGEGRATPIIHRDVSPSNILLSTEGAVKLTDFGIAGAAGDRSLRGKDGYAAPEQCLESAGPTDERTDIYAVGIVLYECLTLRPVSQVPTLSPSVPRTPVPMRAAATLTGPFPGWRPRSPPQICVARAGAPPLLQDVFEFAIQADPAQRYRSARDLGRDLERIGRLVGEATNEDLAQWIRRLVGLRLEADGRGAAPIVTPTGSVLNASGTIRLPTSSGNE